MNTVHSLWKHLVPDNTMPDLTHIYLNTFNSYIFLIDMYLKLQLYIT